LAGGCAPSVSPPSRGEALTTTPNRGVPKRIAAAIVGDAHTAVVQDETDWRAYFRQLEEQAKAESVGVLI